MLWGKDLDKVIFFYFLSKLGYLFFLGKNKKIFFFFVNNCFYFFFWKYILVVYGVSIASFVVGFLVIFVFVIGRRKRVWRVWLFVKWGFLSRIFMF